MTRYKYAGTELALFQRAINWKSYWRSQLEGYVGSHVLEVGAGLGGTTKILCTGSINRWVCVEPDAELAGRLRMSIRNGELPNCCEVVIGTLAEIQGQRQFDTALYIDVLEHIEDDGGELRNAAGLLRPGGHLIVLAPAHQWLCTPFDNAIGHFRRYSKRTLSRLSPQRFTLVRLAYLDSIGFFASLGNRLLLNSSMPNPRQIKIWDHLMVPLSRVVDPLLGFAAGKSVLAVWRKQDKRSKS